MWRSNFEEDWERKKTYLIRSLFQDYPLSPVQEEDESFDPSRPQYSPPTHLPHIYVHERPCSPLPPLIIEMEPNRHDEPEEYYKKLEKKVLKIYRKLFIEGKSDHSDDTSDAGEFDTDGIFWGMQKSPENIENDVDKTEIADTYGAESCGMQKNLGDIEDDFDEAHNSDISVDTNNKIGRKRTISENSYSELSESKKSKCDDDSNRSSTDVLPDSTTDENNILSKTLSSYTDNRSQCTDTEVQDDTLVIFSDNNRNKWKEIEDEEVTMSDTPSSYDKRNKGTETEDKEDKKGSSTSSSYLGYRENEGLAIRGVLSGISPNLKDHRIVRVHADVHRDATDQSIVSPSETTVIEKTANVKEAGSVFLENNAVPDNSRNSSRTEVIREIEVMRTPQIRPSVGSFHNQEHSASSDVAKNSTAMDVELRTLEELTESSSSTTNKDGDENNSQRRKRSWLSDETVYEDVWTQTSFNDDHDYIDNNERNRGILRDIFAGAPKVFRLCSCANHLCAC